MTTNTEPRWECWSPLEGGDGPELPAVLCMVQHAALPVVEVLDHINHVNTFRKGLGLACDTVAGSTLRSLARNR